MLQDFMRVDVVTRRLGYLVLCIIKSVVYCILVNLTGKFIECLKFILIRGLSHSPSAGI